LMLTGGGCSSPPAAALRLGHSARGLSARRRHGRRAPPARLWAGRSPRRGWSSYPGRAISCRPNAFLGAFGRCSRIPPVYGPGTGRRMVETHAILWRPIEGFQGDRPRILIRKGRRDSRVTPFRHILPLRADRDRRETRSEGPPRPLPKAHSYRAFRLEGG
jgi:hypothetical protein